MMIKFLGIFDLKGRLMKISNSKINSSSLRYYDIYITNITDLEKEHQAAINTAQEKMLTDLNEAQASGNYSKIQEASVEFQNITTELAAEYTKRIEEINALNHKAVADKSHKSTLTTERI